MNEPLTIYSKPGCVQCTATMRALDSAGIAYRVIDLTTDAAALDRLKSDGYLQAPVIESAGDIWTGFRPDKIEGVIRMLDETGGQA
ncbi:glutaredoxin-like protein NrdH [Micromonospora sp. DT81.3]|uniref:glutaredoxin-like protein NrdH n=1 Tax=Micromonospora sp. DT81.3 TaxID=3416523 RepID=UPI003CF77E32